MLKRRMDQSRSCLGKEHTFKLPFSSEVYQETGLGKHAWTFRWESTGKKLHWKEPNRPSRGVWSRALLGCRSQEGQRDKAAVRGGMEERVYPPPPKGGLTFTGSFT